MVRRSGSDRAALVILSGREYQDMNQKIQPASRGSDLYEQLLRHIKDRTDAAGRGEKISLSDTIEVAHRLIEDSTSSSRLLETAMGYYNPLDFAISHAANVAIFALKMAIDMGLPERDIEDTVIAGILHDIGFSRIPIYSRGEEEVLAYEEDPLLALSEKDLRLIELHPEFGHDAIARDDPRAEQIAEIILQHHEKADGSGYPNGLLESKQLVQARIISIIDTYEALVHPRPFRDALVPPRGIDAIKSQVRGAYSREMIKALLSSFSVYPMGHFVRLGDRSIGKVIKTYQDNPLRSIVDILFDPAGERIDPPRRLDLKTEQMIYITECLPRFKKQ